MPDDTAATPTTDTPATVAPDAQPASPTIEGAIASLSDRVSALEKLVGQLVALSALHSKESGGIGDKVAAMAEVLRHIATTPGVKYGAESITF